MTNHSKYITKGKVLHWSGDQLLISRKQKIYSLEKGGKKKYIGKLKNQSPLRNILGITRLGARLARNEIRAFGLVNEKHACAVNRESVFTINLESGQVQMANINGDGINPEPPFNLGFGPNGEIIWGEYFSNTQRREVRIFASRDSGKNFQAVYSFAPKEIRHVHNIVFDPYENKYWVLAGDHNEEPGIGSLTIDFKQFKWLKKGAQQFRAVNVFCTPDHLIYATDTEVEDNAIIRISKRDGSVEKLAGVNGSSLHATQCGDYLIISTTVEPLSDPDNTKPTQCALWCSKDGIRWKELKVFEKDLWDARYFQFGTIVLPKGKSNNDQLYYSGQALKGADNKIFSTNLSELWDSV